MKKQFQVYLSAAVLMLAACGEDGEPDHPSAAECEAESEDPDACRAAGCRYTTMTIPKDVDGQCIADTEDTASLVGICVYIVKPLGNNAPFFYSREVDGEEEIRLFNSDHGEILGWDRCEGGCGCVSSG